MRELMNIVNEEYFTVLFRAWRPDGSKFEKKFRVHAADKYVAGDKIKKKLGAEYETFLYPTFISGDVVRVPMPPHVKNIARGLK